MELARADRKRQQRLVDRGARSSQDFDSAKFGQQAIEQQLAAAKSQLQLLQQGTRKEQIAAQRASRDAMMGQLAEIESTRQDSIIVAPFDGRIASRHVDPGAVVSSGLPCLRVISNELEGRFGMPPVIASSLIIGDVVRVNADGQDCQGAIIHLLLPSPSSNGQGANVEPNTFWLPSSALSRGGRGVWTVLAMQGDQSVAKVSRRSIELLRTDGPVSLVRGMIKSGDRIIADGTHRITAGMQVRSDAVLVR